MHLQRKLKIVELYAGTARSVEPFRRWNRCEVSLLVDSSTYAQRTYLENYPSAPFAVEDLSSTTPDWVRVTAGGRVDILLGCPPCQGFSDNGRRSPWDHRNRHLQKFALLVSALRPKAVAMENVPLAVGAKAFQHWTGLLEEAGYVWTAGILNAALYGSTQCRQRLIFIGIHKSVGSEPKLPQPTHGGRRRYFNYSKGCLADLHLSGTAILGTNPATFQVRGLLPHTEEVFGQINIPTVGEILADLPTVGSLSARRLSHIPWAHTARQLRRMSRVPEGGQPRISQRYFASSYGRLHRKGLARTVTGAFPNAGSGRFWHPTENRSLTLREAARIQGFDDGFRFIEPISEAAFLVGNALDAALSDVTFEIIKSCLQ